MIDDTAIVPIAPALGARAGAPAAIEVRCLRLSIAGPPKGLLCCAHGAAIDLRAKLAIDAVASVVWSDALPSLVDRAPSGVVAHLATDATTGACSALDPSLDDGGWLGDGCSLRAIARERGLAEDAWLLDDCALFPLDCVGGVLVPSARIADGGLVRPAIGDTRPTLWQLARAHAALRFGESFAHAVDAADFALRAHATHGIHLKTVK